MRCHQIKVSVFAARISPSSLANQPGPVTGEEIQQSFLSWPLSMCLFSVYPAHPSNCLFFRSPARPSSFHFPVSSSDIMPIVMHFHASISSFVRKDFTAALPKLVNHMEKWPIHRRSSCFFFKLNFKHVYNLQ